MVSLDDLPEDINARLSWLSFAEASGMRLFNIRRDALPFKVAALPV
jgi:hypothetical protein